MSVSIDVFAFSLPVLLSYFSTFYVTVAINILEIYITQRKRRRGVWRMMEYFVPAAQQLDLRVFVIEIAFVGKISDINSLSRLGLKLE